VGDAGRGSPNQWRPATGFGLNTPLNIVLLRNGNGDMAMKIASYVILGVGAAVFLLGLFDGRGHSGVLLREKEAPTMFCGVALVVVGVVLMVLDSRKSK
jgi:hypothetical protein